MLRSTVRRAREEGFTLVELLIVIVVLGILAGIVVFGVSTFRTDATTAACKADQKQLQTAADAYYAKNNTYPAGGTDALRIGVLVTSGYLKSAPSSTAITLSAAGVVGGAC